MSELSSTPTPTLGYATPKTDRKPAPAKLYWTTIGFWAVAAVVGIGCLMGYAVTAWAGFAIAGIFWLFIGGSALTFVAFVLGAIYLGLAIQSKFHGATGRRAARAILLPILNVPLAIGCAAAGAFLAERAARQLTLVVTNPSTAPIDSIEVWVDKMQEHTFGLLPAGETKTFRTRSESSGRLWLVVRQNGQYWAEHLDTNASFAVYDFDNPKRYVVTLAKPADASTNHPFHSP